MDLLCTRRNEVLKELLSWPTERGARLAVVGIGNRADLPQCVWGVGSSTASKVSQGRARRCNWVRGSLLYYVLVLCSNWPPP